MPFEPKKPIEKLVAEAAPNPNGKTLKLYRIGGADFLLQVTPAGVKSWIFRYTFKGKTRAMGLGPLRNTTYAEATKSARKARVLLDDGIDPLAERGLPKKTVVLDQHEREEPSISFRDCATAFIDDHRAGWKSAKHAAQWTATLQKYAYPVLGDRPVADIDVSMIKKVIEPIWQTKNETAERVRSRCEKVLGWAAVHGYRFGDNPARWAGHLSEIFPKRAAVRTIKHHPALPYSEVPDFMRLLESARGVGALVCRLLILTCTRTTECRAATWLEIDMEQKLWEIPASRMKSSRSHRVPLSAAALSLLKQMQALNNAQKVPSKYVFPGQKPGSYPSEAIMLALLKRLDRHDIVPHGFRSSARQYFAEQTSFPREIAEAVLAHAVGDRTEAAYQRSDYLDKRREMMDVWAAHCMSSSLKKIAAGID